MSGFKEYLELNIKKYQLINSILDVMEDDEIDQFGFYLYNEFIDCDDCQYSEDDIQYFTKEDVLSIIDTIGEDFYDDVLDMLEEIDDLPELDELDEAVSRILKGTNKNRKKRKFMSKTKADLRKTVAQRKKDNRQNKAKRKRYYRANKAKISAYQKSRREAIKKGSHKVKMRKRA